MICFFVSVEAPEPALEVTVEYESSGEDAAGWRLDTALPGGVRAELVSQQQLSPEEEDADAILEPETGRFLRSVRCALFRQIEFRRFYHSEL